jgi:integrase
MMFRTRGPARTWAPYFIHDLPFSRDHIRSNRLEQRATKNKQWIRVELPPVVIETLEILPPPKGARQDNRRYFYEDEANLRTLAAVFEQSGVNGAIPHRFRHTLASELLGKGKTLEEIAAILADSPATIRRYCAKWTPEYHSRQDVLIRKIHRPRDRSVVGIIGVYVMSTLPLLGWHIKHEIKVKPDVC